MLDANEVATPALNSNKKKMFQQFGTFDIIGLTVTYVVTINDTKLKESLN